MDLYLKIDIKEAISLKRIKRVISYVLAFAMVFSAFSNIDLVVHAADSKSSPKVEVTTNAKWDALEQELLELREKKVAIRRVSEEGSYITEEEFWNLAKKYDGAERTVYVSRAAAYSEKFVKGGYNAFAYSKTGMKKLRDDYGICATGLLVDGVLTGAIAGGVAGALVGAIASDILGARFRDANNHMKEWINVGSSKGGCRITLTDEFPIAKLDTVQQSPIKKL